MISEHERGVISAEGNQHGGKTYHTEFIIYYIYYRVKLRRVLPNKVQKCKSAESARPKNKTKRQERVS